MKEHIWKIFRAVAGIGAFVLSAVLYFTEDYTGAMYFLGLAILLRLSDIADR